MRLCSTIIAALTVGSSLCSATSIEDNLKHEIHQRLYGCWHPPKGNDSVTVVLRWRLGTDGSLDGDPEILNRNDSFASGFSAAAAIQAVRCASPFSLPKEQYQLWRSIDWTFDPRERL